MNTKSKPNTQRSVWPRNATERAILAVIANWHFAGIRKELRGEAA